MYFEEAKVKEYYRKNKEGVKTPYYQINLSKKSKFSEVKPIALIDVAELEELTSFLDSNKIEETNVKLNELSEEVNELKQQIQEEKATVKRLSSEVKSLKEDKTDLQEKLLTAKNNYEDKAEELTEEKETSKRLLAKIVELNELKVENTFLKNRNWFNRLINKQYSKEEDVPEIVEAEAKPSEE